MHYLHNHPLHKTKGKAAAGEAVFLVSDVLDLELLQQNKKDILEKYGKIDILINVAGGNVPGATLAPDQPFFDMQIADWEKVTNLNLNGTVYPSYIFGEAMAEQGYGKRTNLNDKDEDGNEILDENGKIMPVYRITSRGGKGVKTLNITDKTGKLVSINSVTDNNDLMIINKSGITIRLKVSDIRTMGRATQGVRLINLGKRNDEIASICKVESETEEDMEDVNIVDIDDALEGNDNDNDTNNTEEFN